MLRIVSSFVEKNNLEIVNVKLSPLSDEDIRAIVEIERHPAVRRWLTDYGDEDFEEELEGYRRFFRNLGRNDKVEVLVARIGGRIIGFLALWRMENYEEHVRSIGISVHPDYWGRGIATTLVKEAIKLSKRIGVKKVIIETLEENYAMRRVAEKTGFKIEDIKRNNILKDRKYHDEMVYSLKL
ncbi:MAG: GNAT family protein [Candidatus Bathyarchaeia archaeon]